MYIAIFVMYLQAHKSTESICPLSLIDMKQIEQDARVTVGLNGNLYFSNAIQTDSRRDYCCYASFPRIRTMIQKNAMSVIVSNCMYNPQTLFTDVFSIDPGQLTHYFCNLILIKIVI